MSVGDLGRNYSRSGSISTMSGTASEAAHVADIKARHITGLDSAIAGLAKVGLGAGRTGAGHEKTDSIVKRLATSEHVYALLEKCYINATNPEEGRAAFVEQMKEFLTKSWNPHYKNDRAAVAEKVDSVLGKLMASPTFGEKSANRAMGFKEGYEGMVHSGARAMIAEHQQSYKDDFNALCDDVLARINMRPAKSPETSQLVADLHRDLGEGAIKPMVRLHENFCKSSMRAASPRDVQLQLAKELVKRLFEQKGYSQDDAIKKACHIAVELYKTSKEEIGRNLHNIEGYLQAVGINSDYVQQQKDLILPAYLRSLDSAPIAGEETRQAHLYNCLEDLKKNTSLDASIARALAEVGSSESSGHIAGRFSVEILEDVIRTSLAHRPASAEYSREKLLEDVKAGFEAHFVKDEGSVLKIILGGRKTQEEKEAEEATKKSSIFGAFRHVPKSADEKLSKINDAVVDRVGALFSDDELRGFHFERAVLSGAVEGVVSKESENSLSHYALDRSVEASRAYEQDWVDFKGLIDEYMSKKIGGSYQETSVVVGTIISARPDIFENMARHFYAKSETKEPSDFKFDFFARMQSVLLSKDEGYYFVNDPEKGLSKPNSFYKEAMKHLGVKAERDIKDIGIPRGVGYKGSLSQFEKIRREEIAKKAPWETSLEKSFDRASFGDSIDAYRRYLDAKAAPKIEQSFGEIDFEFDNVVLGEHGLVTLVGDDEVIEESRPSSMKSAKASGMEEVEELLATDEESVHETASSRSNDSVRSKVSTVEFRSSERYVHRVDSQHDNMPSIPPYETHEERPRTVSATKIELSDRNAGRPLPPAPNEGRPLPSLPTEARAALFGDITARRKDYDEAPIVRDEDFASKPLKFIPPPPKGRPTPEGKPEGWRPMPPPPPIRPEAKMTVTEPMQPVVDSDVGETAVAAAAAASEERVSSNGVSEKKAQPKSLLEAITGDRPKLRSVEGESKPEKKVSARDAMLGAITGDRPKLKDAKSRELAPPKKDNDSKKETLLDAMAEKMAARRLAGNFDADNSDSDSDDDDWK